MSSNKKSHYNTRRNSIEQFCVSTSKVKVHRFGLYWNLWHRYTLWAVTLAKHTLTAISSHQMKLQHKKYSPLDIFASWCSWGTRQYGLNTRSTWTITMLLTWLPQIPLSLEGKSVRWVRTSSRWTHFNLIMFAWPVLIQMMRQEPFLSGRGEQTTAKIFELF